jgi:hypothetical protein
MTPPEKLAAIVIGTEEPDRVKNDKEEFINQFHLPGNAEFHQKSLVRSIQYLSPIIAKILNCDIATAELILAAGNIIFDDGLFDWTEEECISHAKAFVKMMEKTLGVPSGYFDIIEKLLSPVKK